MATTMRMSFADFERLEFGADQVELLKGELIRLPPPYLVHRAICERLFMWLYAAVEELRKTEPGRPLGKVHMEMGYRIGGARAGREAYPTVANVPAGGVYLIHV